MSATEDRSRPPSVVVMGVSGVGKSLIGKLLAERLDVAYADGDDFHSPRNIERMRAGHPLTDEDRRPWLEAIGRWLAAHEATGGVVSCSALRRAYRDILSAAAPMTMFLHLAADEELVRARMEQRKGAYMPVALLQSQIDTLEPLEDDEYGVTVNAAGTPEEIVDAFIEMTA